MMEIGFSPSNLLPEELLPAYTGLSNLYKRGIFRFLYYRNTSFQSINEKFDTTKENSDLDWVCCNGHFQSFPTQTVKIFCGLGCSFLRKLLDRGGVDDRPASLVIST